MEHQKNLIPDDDLEYERRLQEQKEKREQLEREHKEKLEKQKKAEIAQREEQARLDRVALIKQKQGFAEAETSGGQAAIIEKPKGKKAIENFFYLYKVPFVVSIIAAALIIFLAVDLLSRKQADVRIVYLPNNILAHSMQELSDYFTQFAEDYNGDGEIVVDVISMPISMESNDMQMMIAYQNNLMVDMEKAKTMIFISDKASEENTSFVDFLIDGDSLQKLYPDNDSIVELGFKLDSKKLEDELGISDIPDDMFIGIRINEEVYGVPEEKFQQRWENSKKFLDNFVSDFYE